MCQLTWDTVSKKVSSAGVSAALLLVRLREVLALAAVPAVRPVLLLLPLLGAAPAPAAAAPAAAAAAAAAAAVLLPLVLEGERSSSKPAAAIS